MATPKVISAFTCEECVALKPIPSDGKGPCAECRKALAEVDAYAFQSYGEAELWNGEKWHRVHYIPGEEVLTGKMVSYVTKGVTARAFAGDLAELERVVKAVIS